MSIGRVPWKTLSDEPCHHVRLIIPLDEVNVSGFKVATIIPNFEPSRGSKGGHRRGIAHTDYRGRGYGYSLFTSWPSGKNLIDLVAICSRMDHGVCPSLFGWYLALLKKIVHHSGASSETRLWATEKLLLKDSVEGLDVTK